MNSKNLSYRTGAGRNLQFLKACCQIKAVKGIIWIRSGKMSNNDLVVAICHSDGKAWQAVRKMQQAGFDIHKDTVAGNSAPTGVDKSGIYHAGDWIKKWGFPSDAILFNIPDIGPIAIGGPLGSVHC